MSLNYAQEKAFQVLQTLGGMSDADLRQRLFAATTSHFLSLRNATSGASGLDARVAADIAALEESLSSVANEVTGSIMATIESLDELELQQRAEQMITLCIEVMQCQCEGAWSLTANRD